MTEPACTGISAAWCPRCGDCACRDDEDDEGELRGEGLNHPDCPLHNRTSTHAEGPCEHETITRRRGAWNCLGCGAALVGADFGIVVDGAPS